MRLRHLAVSLAVWAAASAAAASTMTTALAGDEPAPPDWRAAAAKHGLAPANLERLDRTKLVVAGRAFRQSFEPYVNSDLPTFVTSDSVLNAYHVLLEESVVRLERVRAERLPRVLRPMWDGLPAAAKRFDLPEDLRADVVRRAQILVGTALRVVGVEPPDVPEDVERPIDAETARIVRAETRERPAWLGPPDAGFPFIDYGRFRPRSFYVRDDRLVAYFRATAWLQAIPLRLDRDAELLTALLLGESLRRESPWSVEGPYVRHVEEWGAVLGARGDLPLPTAAWRPDGAVWNRGNAAELRATWLREWEERSPEPADPRHGVEPCFRVLPATTLPDGALLDRCCPAGGAPRLPSGLFVAATLGGAFARREALRGLPDDVRERLGSTFDAMRPLLRSDGMLPAPVGEARPESSASLYDRYLACVATLLDPPDPAAPALFGSDAWQAKSTNAVLAGWAQMRHTWALQARESAMYGATERTVAGFVEPNPRFFRRLADQAGATCEFLDGAGAFDAALDRRELAWLLRDYAAHLRGPDRLLSENDLPDAKASLVRKGDWYVMTLRGGRTANPGEARDAATVAADLAVLDDAVRALEGDGPLPAKLRGCVLSNTPPFRATWIHLERTCRRLSAMAEKELRGAPWDDDERALLLDYGHVLAEAMLYGGNAYDVPQDDAPRATSVFALYDTDGTGTYLHAAIARPRSLYLLWPTANGDVLVRGSVLPYREFARGTRLTDAEWRGLLDSPDAPPAPAWWDEIATPAPPR